MVPLKVLVVSLLGWGGNLDGVVLDFTAPWCGPCQQVSPIVSRLERQGYPIRKVDVDSNHDLVRRFNVQSIPAFILVIDGVEQERLTGGSVSEEQLKRLCSRIPKPAESKSVPPAAPVSSTPAETLAKSPPKSARAADIEVKLAALPEGQFVPPKTAPPVEKAAPAKSGFKFPLVTEKKEKPPAIDQRAGAIPRGKYYDNQTLRAPVQGSPLASSVRIRVKDSQGEDVGSGTIIDSRVGATFVLTCGHIFRNWDKTCVIEVDYFGAGNLQTFAGTRVYHNLEDDVGLISMNVDPLPSCRVAPAGMKLYKGSPVISVGCSGGEKPTEQTLKITALNRYLGADNIECSGVPAQGRSGGGLFTRDGQLVGVCTAAAPHNKEGLYAGLKTVQRLLDHCTLAHLYRPVGASHDQDQLAVDLLEEDEPVADDAGLEIADEVEQPEPRRSVKVAKKTEARNSQKASPPAAAGDEAELREALEQAGEAEIVCIIRPIHQPRAASRVVILNRASRRFVAYLSDELDSQDDIHETTLTKKEHKSAPVARTQEAKRPAGISSARPFAGAATAVEEEVGDSSPPQPYRRKRPAPPLASAR